MKEISLPPGNGGPRASKRRRTSALPRRAAKPRNLSVGELQLTTREKEILRFLAFGLGSSAIARELSISPATVRNHAQRILAKLQVHSRLAAVARGYAIGLLPLAGVAGAPFTGVPTGLMQPNHGALGSRS